MSLKKPITLFLLIVICASCWAPFKDLRKNVPISPEASQDELAREQALMKTQKEVGYVPPITDQQNLPTTATSADATRALQIASDGESAKQALKEAEKKLHETPASTTSMTIWGIVFVLLGVGSVYGVRAYANKVVPEPPKRRRITW